VKTETALSVIRMCEVAGFSRAGYYRFGDPAKPAAADMDLRDEMQKIALSGPVMGAGGSGRNGRPTAGKSIASGYRG
jgi:hypothetical protein